MTIITFQINLISLAVNVDASKLNKTFFAESSSSEESDENQLHSGETNKLTDGGITEGELKDIEHALLKELTPTQVKQAMIIFQGLREGASAKETEDALVSHRIQFQRTSLTYHLHLFAYSLIYLFLPSMVLS